MKQFLFIALSIIAISVYAQSPNTNPIFGKYPYISLQKITAATTATHTLPTTNLKLMLTGATNGTKVAWCQFIMDSTSSASVGFIAISDTTGSNPVILTGVNLSATSFTTTTVGTIGTLLFTTNEIELHSGQKLYTGATVIPSGSYINAACQYGEY